ELNNDLVALGYADGLGLDASSDEFSWATKVAVERLQAAFGVDETGALSLGQVVFLPTAVRVTTVSATLGGQSGGTVLLATSTTRQVSIALDAAEQSQVKKGDKVMITLPNNRTTPGTVTSVGTVATSSSSNSSSSDNGPGSTPTITVKVTPTHSAATGTLDQAPVQVSITTASVGNTLVVPVTALLALAGGGYAVEVIGAHAVHSLVPVEPGLFDDAAGLVQVAGSGLRAGQHVVVPAA
ncbi:MAG: peptidoglycan-binding protein, partial [Sciscionella sp.]